MDPRLAVYPLFTPGNLPLGVFFWYNKVLSYCGRSSMVEH